MIRRLTLSALFGACVLMTGCASPTPYEIVAPEASNTVILENEKAAAVLAQLLVKQQPLTAPVLVATVANLDDLDTSSSLGRLISEEVSAGLVHHGLPVLEAKLRHDLFIRSGEGELLLSRHVRDLSATYRAELVIVGTYTLAGATAYVTLKAVNPLTNIVQAAYSYSLPAGAFLGR